MALQDPVTHWFPSIVITASQTPGQGLEAQEMGVFGKNRVADGIKACAPT